MLRTRISPRRPLWTGLRRAGATALLLMAAATPAWSGGIKVTGPAIELSPPRFDFGELPQERIEKVTCTVRNAGSDVLLIRDITSTCGCTVASIPDSSLAPGESVPLAITFSTRHFSGEVTKLVTLVTNDPGSPKAVITLNAFVRAIVAVDPDELDFGMVARGATPSQTITLRSAAADAVELVEFVVPEQTFKTEVSKETTPDSTFTRVKVSIRPDAPVGTFASTARLRTSVKGLPPISISLTGQIHGFFVADPGRLPLGQVRQGQERTGTIQLIAQREGHHRVLGVRSSDPRLECTIKPIEEGRRYEIGVKLPSTAAPGRMDATVLVETDDPDQPEVSVSVRAYIRGRSS